MHLSPRRRIQALIVACTGLFLGQSNCNCTLQQLLADVNGCGCASSACPAGSGTLPGYPYSGPSKGFSALTFEANSGQADPRYEFLARAGGMKVYLDDGTVSLDVRDGDGASAGLIQVGFSGGSGTVEAEAENPLPGRVNYFLGNDPSRWVKDVPTFGRIRYKGVYPGIDVVYYGNDGSLEHDFIVAPGADPAKIRMRLNGASGHHLTSGGDLIVEAAGREITWKKPVLYQQAHGIKRRVEGRFREEKSGELGFEVGVFDVGLPLVIDPVIVYSTYVGRGGNDTGGRIAIDSSGNSYLTGLTNSDSFPVTPGAPSGGPATAQRGNVIITKLNAAGTEIVYSTHIGGLNNDWSPAIAVDANGNAYVAGTTASDDFPTTDGVLQKRYASTRLTSAANVEAGDCFVLKLNAAGNGLVYSTYLGGTKSDGCTAIAVDSGGNAYVTGFTGSGNFPVTENAFQRSNFGGNENQTILRPSDAFVAKINPSGSALVYASYLGGTGEDAGTAIAVDAFGNAFVAGATNSAFGFPVTRGAAQVKFAGSGGNGDIGQGDAFAVKVNADGSALAYATLIGGRRDDIAFGIAVDANSAAYVTGATMSTDFPVTAVARQANYRGEGGVSWLASGDAFVVKVNPAGSAFEYATYLGGTRDDRGIGIAVDQDLNAWVTGNTVSLDFPTTSDALQRSYQGDRDELYRMGDAFVLKLSPNGQTLLYSSFLGGQANDWGVGIALDRAGAVYVSGGTSSSNFPVSDRAAQRTYGTAPQFLLPLGDAFVTKISETAQPPTGPLVSISRVSSAASFDGPAVAPGEIVMLNGVDIGPAKRADAAVTADGRLTTTIAETRVLFDGVAAPMVSASATATSAIVPYAVAGKTATQVVVEYQGTRSAAMTLPVVASAPGLFSANGSGRGPAAALNPDWRFNTSANPANKGDVIVLFGTGEGQTVPSGIDGLINTLSLPKPLLPVRLTIGGVAAEIVASGALQGQTSGAFEISAKVPATLAPGEALVVVTIGAASSQAGLTISVR